MVKTATKKSTLAPAHDFFVEAAPVKAKGKKGHNEMVEIRGLEQEAAIDLLIKALTTLKKSNREIPEGDMKDYFAQVGCLTKSQPKNFTGREGKATASCEWRKRSSRSGLNEFEIALAKKHNITTEEISDVDETFVIDPAHLDWLRKNKGKLNKMFEAAGAPKGLIKWQTAPKRTVVTRESMAEIFSKPQKTAKMLMSLVGTMAIKPVWNGEFSEALELVSELLEDYDPNAESEEE